MSFHDWLNRQKLKIISWLLAHHKDYSTISSAGPEDGGTYDTYWIRLIKYKPSSFDEEDAARVEELGILDTSPEEEYRLNVRLNDDGELKGREMYRHDEDQPKPERFITPEMLDSHSLEIRHFYKDHEFGYTGVFVPALRRWLRCNEWLYQRYQAKVRRRSRRFTPIDDYIQVLEALVRASQFNRNAVLSLEVCQYLYGDRLRMVSTEKLLEADEQCQIALDYLAEVGDVAKFDGGYRPNAKTLHAISARQKERLSEKREVRVQHYQLALTIILALSSLALAVFEGVRLFWLQI